MAIVSSVHAEIARIKLLIIINHNKKKRFGIKMIIKIKDLE